MKDSTVIFLGGLFLEQVEKEIVDNSKSNVQNAANIFQWNLVEGIESNIQSEINIVSAPYVGYYPTYYKKAYVSGYTKKRGSNHMERSIGFVNIFGIKEKFRQFGVYKGVKQIIEESNKEEVFIIVYAMNTALMKAAVKAKKNSKKRIHICLVCPDLPQYMNMGMNRSNLFKILKSMDIKAQEKLISQMDSFVYLTKYMNDSLNKENKPWCVVEGIVTEKTEDDFSKANQKTILYAGGICEEYGVYDLIHSFLEVPHAGWKLVLCGSVDEKIKKQYEKEEVEFLGMLPNARVKQLEREATLLVNPRPNKGEFTRFSFPSKTLEYMLSGTPVLMYGLGGMPEEYYNHVYTVEPFGGSLKDALFELMSFEETVLEEKGKAARAFVLKEKNAKIQCKKIIDMIKGAVDE